MERLLPNDQHAALTMEHLESFAKDGLRTLCLGYRTIPADEYKVEKNRVEQANYVSFASPEWIGMAEKISWSVNSNQ